MANPKIKLCYACAGENALDAKACVSCSVPLGIAKLNGVALSPKEEARGGWFAWVMVAVLGGAVVLAISSCVRSCSAANPPSASASPSAPLFELVDEKKEDSPFMAMLEAKIVVPPPITSAKVQGAMRAWFDSAAEKTGFEHQAHPTHLRVFAYARKETARGGWGHILGRMDRMGETAKVDVFVDEGLVAKWNQAPEERFGLSQEVRFRIYVEYMLAEVRAIEDRPRLAPDGDGYERLKTAYQAEARKKHNLDAKTMEEIRVEGEIKGW